MGPGRLTGGWSLGPVHDQRYIVSVRMAQRRVVEMVS